MSELVLKLTDVLLEVMTTERLAPGFPERESFITAVLPSTTETAPPNTGLVSLSMARIFWELLVTPVAETVMGTVSVFWLESSTPARVSVWLVFQLELVNVRVAVSAPLTVTAPGFEDDTETERFDEGWFVSFTVILAVLPSFTTDRVETTKFMVSSSVAVTVKLTVGSPAPEMVMVTSSETILSSCKAFNVTVWSTV